MDLKKKANYEVSKIYLKLSKQKKALETQLIDEEQ